MNIAIFTDTFLPQVNGVVTATINIAKGLAERGHKVHIIAPKNYSPNREFKFKNVFVKRIHGVPAAFYEGFKLTSPFNVGLMSYIADNKIDVIHFQTPSTIGINAILLAKLMNLPLIGTFHTFIAHPEYRKHAKLDFKFLDNFSWSYIRGNYNRCDLITSPSNETKKELLKRGLKNPIRVISNGINFKMFDNSKVAQIKKKYGRNSKLILFVGRIAYEKNIFFLIDSFEKVTKKVRNAKLLIVGSGPQISELKKIVISKNLLGKVFLLGEINHEKLVKSSIFKACDIFATASITENQPMTVLEAQANGLPCVGLNKMGMKDLIKNNYNGYLVKPEDKEEFSNKIIELLSNKKLLKKMKKNTLEMIKQHNLQEVINQWEQAYLHVIWHKQTYFNQFKSFFKQKFLKKSTW